MNQKTIEIDTGHDDEHGNAHTVYAIVLDKKKGEDIITKDEKLIYFNGDEHGLVSDDFTHIWRDGMYFYVMIGDVKGWISKMCEVKQ